MIAIHTKYISATDNNGSRIKAYTAGYGDRKGFSAVIGYPHKEDGYMAHFEAVKELIKKNALDWNLEGMRWGDSADGKGYSFCFDCSKVGI